jgi:carboxypeptidase C (cathepsin A)
MIRILLAFLVSCADSTYPSIVDHSQIPFPNRMPLSLRSVSGYIPLSSTAETFYWLFLSEKNPEMKPTIFWVQGQIGVSSMFGVLNEFTPAWLRDFNMVFVDAPIGTGFSHTSQRKDVASSSEEVAAQLFHFLNLFHERHHDDISRNTIVAGEDYAGHTIPVLAYLALHKPAKFTLIGTSVGNGHTHAPIQVITKAESAAIFGLTDGECITRAREHAWTASFLSTAGDSIGSLNQRNMLEQTILNCSSGIDMSNIGHLTSETNPSELMQKLNFWMNDQRVHKALNISARIDHIPTAKNQTVFDELKPDIMKVIWQYIPSVLERNVSMLWYQGQLDWVDGVYSNEAWINALEWNGAQHYAKTKRQTWEGGYKRSYGPLTEAMLLNTGHLAIREKPDQVLQLFKDTFLPVKEGNVALELSEKLVIV